MCCPRRSQTEVVPKNVVDEVRISESLLKGKKMLTESTTKCLNQLNDIWCKFDEQIADDDGLLMVNGLQKSSSDHFQNCTELGSPWILRITPPISDHYTLMDMIGTPGSYGLVKEAVKTYSGEIVAVKCIKKLRYKDKEQQRVYFSDLRSEVYLMKQASDHPHIVKVHSVYEDIENLYLVLSYCAGGQLHDAITENRESLTEMIAADIFRQMVSSIYYIHSLGIAHCDLKPENFVFADKERKQLVLIDFGMSKIIGFRKYFDTVAGSPYYVAPEVLQDHYNEACDIWSLGVCLFAIVFGYPPFFDESGEALDVFAKIIQGFEPTVKPGYGAWFPETMPVSPECRDLIARMLRTNTADRLTAEEILEHPWLKMNIFEEKEDGDDSNEPKLKRSLSPNLVQISNPAVLNSLKFHKKSRCALHGKVLELLTICKYLNSNQMKSLEGFLSAADTNKDGQISPSELYNVLKRVDPDVTLKDAESIVIAIDVDHNGLLNFEEMLSSRINRKLNSKENRLRKVFQTLDYNKDGRVTVRELEAVWESVFQEPVQSMDFKEIIAEVDKDGDHAIDYEEFISAFCKSRRGSIEKRKEEELMQSANCN